MNEKKGFFKGVVIGGIIGSITALLFAPKSGEELRADIKNKLDEASVELGHKIQEAKKSTQSSTKDLIEKAERLQKILNKKSDEISKSGKKIGKVTSSEAKNLAAQAKELSAQLASSTKKVVDTSKKEVERIHKKTAQERAKKQYVDPSKSPADKK